MKASWASLHIGTEEFLIRSKNNLDLLKHWLKECGQLVLRVVCTHSLSHFLLIWVPPEMPHGFGNCDSS